MLTSTVDPIKPQADSLGSGPFADFLRALINADNAEAVLASAIAVAEPMLVPVDTEAFPGPADPRVRQAEVDAEAARSAVLDAKSAAATEFAFGRRCFRERFPERVDAVDTLESRLHRLETIVAALVAEGSR